MINSAVIKIINNIDNLTNNLNGHDLDSELLKPLIKIKNVVQSELTEKEKIEFIKKTVSANDIFSLCYLIEGPIETLEDSLIAQNTGIIKTSFLKISDDISEKDKKERIAYISENFDTLINKGNNLTDIIELINHPIKEVKREEYKSSMDLPFSNKTLFLKVADDGIIYFRLDEQAPWLVWEGSNFCYNVLKQNRFKSSSRWYVKNELALIDKYIEIFYTSSLCYFKNVK